jgi:hypothetical protein
VAELHAGGCKRESVRKTLSLAHVLDIAKVEPSPARDGAVKLPREAKREPKPPTAVHFAAAVEILPAAYKLPVIVLDGATWTIRTDVGTLCTTTPSSRRSCLCGLPMPLSRLRRPMRS